MLRPVEGIILFQTPYQDSSEILDIFTPCGILPAIRKFGRQQGKLSPFQHIDAIFEETKGELFRLKDVKVIKTYLNVRKSLESMEAALKMAKALKLTQVREQDTALLFKLFALYLEELYKNPSAFLASFYLKLLLYEGLFHPDDFDSELPLRLSSTRSLNELIQINTPLESVNQIEKHFFNLI